MTCSNSMPQAWLVYEEGESYDGGNIPLLVAATEALALNAKTDIEKVVTDLQNRLDRTPCPHESGISTDEAEARYDRRFEMLDHVCWPYGLKREKWDWNLTVGVLPLPFIQEAT